MSLRKSSDGAASNPWLERLSRCTDPDFVRSRAELKPKPLIDLNAIPPDEAVATLMRAFDQTYYVSDTACHLITEILSRARVGVASRYTGSHDFIKTIYDGNIPNSRAEPICITGLAGIGKSQLLTACRRVLPNNQRIQVDDNHSAFPLQSMWHIQLTARQALRPMLKQVATQTGNPLSVRNDIDETYNFLRANAYRNGVALLAADEFQFANQDMTSKKNSKAAGMLLMLREIGVTLVFAVNYSLMHRLETRPQEEQQRLFSRVRLFERADLDSRDWLGLIQSLIDNAPDVFRIESLDDAARLWTLTAGLPRNLHYLLVMAYEIVRAKGQTKVDVAMCEVAYRSQSFARLRRDTEALARQAITGQPVKGRKDLDAPFASDSTALPKAMDRIRDLQAIQRTRADLIDSFTPKERAAFKRRAQNSNAYTPEDKSGRTRASPNNGNFMEGLELFKRSLGPKNPK